MQKQLICKCAYQLLSYVSVLLSKVLSYHRQTLQWEILLHEVSGEDEDEHRVDEAGNSTGEVSVSLGHSHEEDEGENHIDHHLLHRIVDRILLLTHKVGESIAVPYPAKPAQAQAM